MDKSGNFTYQDIPVGDRFSLNWNPSSEQHPKFVNDLYSPNQDFVLSLIVQPPGEEENARIELMKDVYKNREEALWHKKALEDAENVVKEQEKKDAELAKLLKEKETHEYLLQRSESETMRDQRSGSGSSKERANPP